MVSLYEYLSSEPSLVAFSSSEKISPKQEDIEKLLRTVLYNGPKMYKVYTIPKRNGGKRVIAHPAKPLKAVQRSLLTYLKMHLPIHKSAFAYQEGISIKDNAYKHINNTYHLRMDLHNFFNSIDISVLNEQLKLNNISFEPDDLNLLYQCIFWSPAKSHTGKLILSVGAPSSPFVSNFIMYKFDAVMSNLCDNLNITYTRYADDLFFSTKEKNILFGLPTIVKYVLKEHYSNKLNVNESKTSFSSKAHNRHVTGVVISNNNLLSLGRNKKRYISSEVHKYTLGLLDEVSVLKLQGMLSFAKSIEPVFLLKLERKYSKDILNEITTGRWKNGRN